MFQIYNTTLVTSSGKNQQVHFDGIYYLVAKELNTVLQIRSNGSPKLKGVKFSRQNEFEDFKVYKLVDDTMTNIDYNLIRFYEKLIEREELKRVYLSVVKNQIHLGIWFKKHPLRKQKRIDLEKINQIYQLYMDQLQMIQSLSDLDTYL